MAEGIHIRHVVLRACRVDAAIPNYLGQPGVTKHMVLQLDFDGGVIVTGPVWDALQKHHGREWELVGAVRRPPTQRLAPGVPSEERLPEEARRHLGQQAESLRQWRQADAVGGHGAVTIKPGTGVLVAGSDPTRDRPRATTTRSL